MKTNVCPTCQMPNHHCFAVGDVVMCIMSSRDRTALKEGRHYTIVGVEKDNGFVEYVDVAEVSDPAKVTYGWFRKRFLYADHMKVEPMNGPRPRR